MGDTINRLDWLPIYRALDLQVLAQNCWVDFLAIKNTFFSAQLHISFNPSWMFNRESTNYCFNLSGNRKIINKSRQNCLKNWIKNMITIFINCWDYVIKGNSHWQYRSKLCLISLRGIVWFRHLIWNAKTVGSTPDTALLSFGKALICIRHSTPSR